VSLLDEVARVDGGAPFPPTSRALDEPESVAGLLAVGGPLTGARLLEAARQGIFPLYEPDTLVMWWAPARRMVIPVAEARLSHTMRPTLRRFIRKPECEVRVDAAFERVLEGCATTVRKGQDGPTWILPELERAYLELWRAGSAHSFETWIGGELVGGLFGLDLGRTFSIESMFSRRSDASKIAFAALTAFGRAYGIATLDCQLYSPHLASLGGRLVPRADYERDLTHGAERPPVADWRFDPRSWELLDLDAQAPRDMPLAKDVPLAKDASLAATDAPSSASGAPA
jgi:leucyl/phenylalanyl-tRNA---protein transferase